MSSGIAALARRSFHYRACVALDRACLCDRCAR
jgi:hypothetical protein